MYHPPMNSTGYATFRVAFRFGSMESRWRVHRVPTVRLHRAFVSVDKDGLVAFERNLPD
jgi:hypothetical protein